MDTKQRATNKNTPHQNCEQQQRKKNMAKYLKIPDTSTTGCFVAQTIYISILPKT